MILETERLLLRPTSEEDAPFLLELVNSPGWLEFIGDRKVYTEEEAREYIRKRILPQFERLGHSNFTVIRKSDQAKIGSCGLYDREGIEGVDIGFAFLPAYHGYGYAFESAQRVMAAGMEHFSIKNIKAITVKNNLASQKLLEKLGLVYLRDTRIPGDDEVLMLYEIQIP
ncbi:MAG: GNAT family N-acetyltransferase [Bacteroidia bacterium]